MTTMLAQGTAVTVAESPADLDQVDGIAWTDVVGLRRGWGSTFRGKAGKFVWFHIPFMVPTVVNDQQQMMRRMDVLFDVAGQAAVEVVDGWGSVNSRWFHRDGLSLTRDASFAFDPPVPILGSISISVGVRFREAANITFRGAMVA